MSPSYHLVRSFINFISCNPIFFSFIHFYPWSWGFISLNHQVFSKFPASPIFSFLWKEILEILSWQTEICFSFCKIPFPKIQCIGRTIYLALLWDVSNAIFFWIFLMQCSSRWSPISIHPSLPPNSPVTRSLISLDLDIIIITLAITIITTITITTILRSTALCVPQEEEAAGRGESEAQPLIQDHGHISNQVIIIVMVRII